MPQRIRPSRSLLSTPTVGALLGTVLLSGESAGAHSPESAPTTEQTSQSVAITQTNSENLNQTHRNTHATLTQTGSFTVTNIENDPTPSENNYRYKLSIWNGLG